LIDSWEIVRRSKAGRMVSVTVTLSEWLFRAVLAKSVLTLSRDYFRLRKPLERRIYELARKHCGRQPDWQVSMSVLHKKAGSAAPLRVFRAAIRRMIEADGLPGYTLAEEPGDLLRVSRRGVVVEPGSGPVLSPEALEQARALAPGLDVHVLEARWRGWWAETGRKRLGNADRAFLGWVATQVTR
jgi:plasmid replication initiation protein